MLKPQFQINVCVQQSPFKCTLIIPYLQVYSLFFKTPYVDILFWKETEEEEKEKKGTGSSICSTYLLPQILIFSMEIYKVCITDAFSPWSFVNAKHSRYTHSARSRARTTDLTFTKRCQVFFSLVSCCLFPPRFHFHHHYALYSLFYTARGK